MMHKLKNRDFITNEYVEKLDKCFEVKTSTEVKGLGEPQILLKPTPDI